MRLIILKTKYCFKIQPSSKSQKEKNINSQRNVSTKIGIISSRFVRVSFVKMKTFYFLTVLLHATFVRIKTATVSEEWVIHIIFFFTLLWRGSLNFSTIILSYINSIASYVAIYLRGDSWKRFYWDFKKDLQKDQLSLWFVTGHTSY